MHFVFKNKVRALRRRGCAPYNKLSFLVKNLNSYFIDTIQLFISDITQFDRNLLRKSSYFYRGINKITWLPNGIKILLSIPVFLYGDNISRLKVEDYERFIVEMDLFLKQYQIQGSISNATVSLVHLCKDTEFKYAIDDLIALLYKADMPNKRYKKDPIESNSRAVVYKLVDSLIKFYSKVGQLISKKHSRNQFGRCMTNNEKDFIKANKNILRIEFEHYRKFLLRHFFKGCKGTFKDLISHLPEIINYQRDILYKYKISNPQILSEVNICTLIENNNLSRKDEYFLKGYLKEHNPYPLNRYYKNKFNKISKGLKDIPFQEIIDHITDDILLITDCSELLLWIIQTFFVKQARISYEFPSQYYAYYPP